MNIDRVRRPHLVRLGLAATFAAILLALVAVDAQWAHAAGTVIGFAVAITAIAAVAVEWERGVVTAQSAGLVEIA
jgi:hypothetical protein